MTILKFEFKKLIKNKVNFIIMLGILLLTMVSILVPNYSAESELDYFRSELSTNKSVYNELKDTPEAEVVVADTQEVIGYLDSLISSLETGMYEDALQYELKFQNKLYEDMRAGRLVGGVSHIEQERTVSELDYLYTNGYSKNREVSTFEFPLANYLLFLFSSGIFPSLLILMAISLLVSQLITYDSRKNTYHLISILPTKISALNVSKYIMTSLFTLVSILLPILIMSIIVLIKNGVGNTNYPISRIIENRSVEIMTTTSFVSQNIVFIILWTLTITSASLLLYQFSGNTFLHVIFSLTFIILSQFDVFASLLGDQNNTLLGYLPTSYVDFQTVITGGNGYYPLSANNINFSNGVISLIFTSVLCLVVSTIVSVVRKNKTNSLF